MQPSSSRSGDGTQRRPTGVYLLAVLAIMDGVFDLVAAFTALTAASVVDTRAMLGGGMLTLLGLVLLVIAFLLFCLGYGLWMVRPWAWSLGIGLEVLNIGLGVVRLVGGREIYPGVLLTFLLAGTILYYLVQRPVRTLFGRA